MPQDVAHLLDAVDHRILARICDRDLETMSGRLRRAGGHEAGAHRGERHEGLVILVLRSRRRPWLSMTPMTCRFAPVRPNRLTRTVWPMGPTSPKRFCATLAPSTMTSRRLSRLLWVIKSPFRDVEVVHRLDTPGTPTIAGLRVLPARDELGARDRALRRDADNAEVRLS